MKKLRNRFERFCFQYRNIGVPNLMLFITIGAAAVYLMSTIAGNYVLYYALCFDRTSILHGEVWRLFTYVFTSAAPDFGPGGFILTAISLLCFYTLGRSIEQRWGTLRFNLYYLCGIVLMDIYCMVFGAFEPLYASAASLNLSLFLGFATMCPDARFLLLYFIPVKAQIFALIYLGLTLTDVISLIYQGYYFNSVFALVALLNYFLFFGKEVANVFPISWRNWFSGLFRKKSNSPRKAEPPKTIPFSGTAPRTASPVKAKPAYNHRCTICGRTDVSDPDLEFRYCSRCNGYYCYCQDHINNHTHVQ